MKLLKKYALSLQSELNKILNLYYQRLENNPHGDHKKLSSSSKSRIISSTAAIGSLIGTAVPGIGNAIGAGGGVIVGACAIGCLELSNKRENKKLDNAIKVTGYFEKCDNNYLTLLSHHIIYSKAAIISKVKYSKDSRNLISKYLANNIFAAIKHNNYEPNVPIHTISIGLGKTKSNKIFSQKLKTLDNKEITLSQIAKYKP